MRKIKKLFFFTILFLYLASCANRGTPSGGEIDETPPSITKSSPENYTLNFKSNEIRVYFDEYIKFKNLQKYLIISPPIDPPPEITPLGSASKYLKIKFQESKTIVFVIGGAFGFSKDLYSKSVGLISLSTMTFSHQIIRLFFTEQLYRAFTILNNHPYHND